MKKTLKIYIAFTFVTSFGFIGALAQSPLDRPAKTSAITLGSEIRRGYQDVWSTKLPQDAEESKTVIDRMIQTNDLAGRKTDGYVIGVHFGLWAKLEIGWEIYQEGSLAKEQYDAVASAMWNYVKIELLEAKLTLPELLQTCPVEAARLAKWQKHYSSSN
jgi:hypothetical protein